MFDLPVTFFTLGLVFVVSAVLLDGALLKMGYQRDRPIPEEWPIWKQQLVRDVRLCRIFAQVLAFVFCALFIITAILSVGVE